MIFNRFTKRTVALIAAALALWTLVSCSPRVTVRTHENTGASVITPTPDTPTASPVTPTPETPTPETPTPETLTPETPTPVTPTPVTPTPETPTPVTPTPVTPTPVTPTPETPTPVTPTPVTPTPVTPTPVTPTPVTPTPVTPTPVTPTPVTPTPVTPTPTIFVPPYDPLVFNDYQYQFKADLSEYEKYMNVKGEDYLILVNKDHPLSKDYAPSDLVVAVNTRADRSSTNDDGSIAVGLRLYAEKAMEALYLEADANGMLYTNTVSGKTNRLGITTAYRSYATQKYLFNKYTERDMAENPGLTRAEVEAIVETYSCRPGTSEHQTGLCVDMHNWPTAGRYMADEFAESPVGVWLQENCYKFGFILRFPDDKTDVTGITYESWHFRFVGRFHATRMHELNMCLEEYIAYLESCGCTINVSL